MDSYFEGGVKLKGTLRVKGAVHFDGEFEGEVFSSNHFIVGKAGKLFGNINSHNFTNMGSVQGNIFSENRVTLMNGSQLKGDISSFHLVIDEGSNFEGLSKMISPPKNPEEPEEIPEQPSAAVSMPNPVVKPVLKNPKVKNQKARAALVGLGLLALGGGGYLYLTPSNDLDALVSKGYALMEESKVSDAEALFKKALGMSRANPEVYAGLGEVYYSKNRYNEALNQFQRSIDLNPSNSDYRIKLAKTLTATGKTKEAKLSYKTAIEMDPENYRA